ncbi:hypothetical protein [uncultured Arthrobacter sp.]|uniref:hypothetical protein n=1 Tax=uncultured Arthrobacter sp. TaxID=114050 RepID=UPI00263754DA|nr:hypothetical protein [uncultured Arthrobacter sp.]
MSTPGAGNRDESRGGSSPDGDERVDSPGPPTRSMDLGGSGRGSSVAGTAGGTDGDDDAGDYVPGMYSDAPHDTDEHTGFRPAPVSASKDAHASTREPTTQEHTQVAPVTATRSFGDTGAHSGDREQNSVAGRPDATGSTTPSVEDRKVLHQREKEHFGGMKFGSAFFGWLTATGMFVLLSALIGAVAALFGAGADLSTADLTSGSGEVQAAGITAAVIFGIALLLSYYAGGYVAGRMARFSGAKQGVAVWLWAVIVAVVVTVVGLIVGNQANVTDQFQNLNLPSVADLTVPGLISLLVVAAVALLGAVLGGLAGMRYHRRIDRTDFDAVADRAGR